MHITKDCNCKRCTHILLRKLYFTTLNYTLNYTLHLKFFECMFCTLNYNFCYTLHSDIKFVVNLDGNLKFRVQSVIKSII